MFARKENLCAGIPTDPLSQECLQKPLLEKGNKKSAKLHLHEKAEEDLSLAVVGSPILAKIQSCSFLLGLIMAFFLASSAFSAHILAFAVFGDDVNPGTVILFSIWSICFFTSVTITLGFFRALNRHIYPVSGDLSEENKKIIIWHIECCFRLGRLIGVCSAWVLIDFWLGIDRHINYTAGILVGIMMLSLIFQFFSGNRHRYLTFFGSLVLETHNVSQSSFSVSNKHGTIDPFEMRRGEVAIWTV